ncbi:hypothetical protein Vadar_026423 [Vaccinium darrowii]|uniref:Uncharacterized protein n=1 Tax=Vaccinium darrowii TaxID=229202 RepID=A0ACB7ZE73_9ERIC|nr:hypothetical protein Vadar_026423 [Vaccinium darrowii]
MAEDSPIEEQSSKDRVVEKCPRPKSPSKKRAAPQSLAETTERPRKKKLAEAPTKKSQTKSFQFRSNLRPFFQLIKEANFSTGQLEALKKTPFWLLFNAFISKKVHFSKIRKDDWFICGIIETYSREGKKFKLGNSWVALTNRDISLIFGIQSGCLSMASKLSSLSKPSTPFVERNFNNDVSLTRPLLEACFRKVVKGKTQAHYEDVARVLCLHLCCTVFFPNKGNAIRWGFVRCIEDLETIKDYAWPGLIRKALISSIKSAEVSKLVTGCALVLPYWLCEHSSLVEAEGDQIPRFLKWDLPLVNRKNTETSTKKIEIQVSASQLVVTEEERKLFPALELEKHEETQEGLEDEFAEEEEGKTEEEEETQERDPFTLDVEGTSQMDSRQNQTMSTAINGQSLDTQERDPATSDVMGLSQMESRQNETMPSSATIGQGLDTQERDPLTLDAVGLSQMESRQNPTISTTTNF